MAAGFAVVSFVDWIAWVDVCEFDCVLAVFECLFSKQKVLVVHVGVLDVCGIVLVLIGRARANVKDETC